VSCRAADLSSPRYDICTRTFRFHWFSFAFVLATLIGMMIATAVGAGLHYSRPFWIGASNVLCDARSPACCAWNLHPADTMLAQLSMLLLLCYTAGCSCQHLNRTALYTFLQCLTVNLHSAPQACWLCPLC
jgi:hypothetical protein